MHMKSMHRYRRTGPARRRTAGFSLIEVLVSLLILAFGLLGFALLQTMNLRFAQSANNRTQATNLAYDLLDQMRSNRLLAAQYTGLINADATATACTRPVGAVTIPLNLLRWKCQLTSALGPGSSANVSYVPASGVATVAITWGDERWNDADKNGTVSAIESNKTFSVSTRL